MSGIVNLKRQALKVGPEIVGASWVWMWTSKRSLLQEITKSSAVAFKADFLKGVLRWMMCPCNADAPMPKMPKTNNQAARSRFYTACAIKFTGLNNIVENTTRETFDTLVSNIREECDTGIKLCDKIQRLISGTRPADLDREAALKLFKAAGLNEDVLPGTTYLDILGTAGHISHKRVAWFVRTILLTTKGRAFRHPETEDGYTEACRALVAMHGETKRFNKILLEMLESLGRQPRL